MRHLDQASRAPLGTDERTRLSLTKTSQTLGAPSARGREDSDASAGRETRVRKKGRAAIVEAQAQNTLADLTGTKPLTAKATDRDITGKLPSQVNVNVGTHGAKRSPSMRGMGMFRG